MLYMNYHIRQFQKRYRGTTIEFNELEFTEGVQYVLGENGSGKSTLLKGISSMISATVISNKAQVVLCSEECSMPPYMSVLSYIQHHVNMTKQQTFPVETLLNGLSLTPYLHNLMKECSKGMKAKIRFLIAVMGTYDVYAFDEPFSGVDQQSIRFMKTILNKLKGVIIIASHIPHDSSNPVIQID